MSDDLKTLDREFEKLEVGWAELKLELPQLLRTFAARPPKGTGWDQITPAQWKVLAKDVEALYKKFDQGFRNVLHVVRFAKPVA